MTQITIDRAIVEQALETIEGLTRDRLFTAEWARVHGATIAALRAVLAEPQPNTLHGWVFKRNADGSVGIFAPPPKPGESRRTSDCVGPQDRDLNELLGKLADHMAALPEPVQEPVAWYQKRGQEVLTSHPACWGREDEPWTPLYTAPPQRKPLTEEEIDAATAQERDALLDHIYEYGTAAEGVLERIRKLCRATERAHGIKE
jgi:hypothetical protein